MGEIMVVPAQGKSLWMARTPPPERLGGTIEDGSGVMKGRLLRWSG